MRGMPDRPSFKVPACLKVESAAHDLFGHADKLDILVSPAPRTVSSIATPMADGQTA